MCVCVKYKKVNLLLTISCDELKLRLFDIFINRRLNIQYFLVLIQILNEKQYLLAKVELS